MTHLKQGDKPHNIIINKSSITFGVHKSKNGTRALFQPPNTRIRQIQLIFNADGFLQEMSLAYEAKKGSFHFRTNYDFNHINDL